MHVAAGRRGPEAEDRPPATVTAPPTTERRVVPQSVVSRQLANPFLAPDFSNAPTAPAAQRRLATWELLRPLFQAFETPPAAASSCMPLPEPGPLKVPGGLELMPHQSHLVAAAAAGHRTFLLADEPGLGKTAQALLAAEAANAYPLLVVVPNVVKTNWAREAGLWTPAAPGDRDPRRRRQHRRRSPTSSWSTTRSSTGTSAGSATSASAGMVVDEAHFIKNKTSQRSQHVLQLSERIRARIARPLLMALTGTPLINDIEDFRAIWQFLGWIDDKKPRAELMDALEDTGLTPARPRLLPGRPQARDRPRHRPSPQGRRGRRHPGPPDRRPARRARRRGRPLDPRGRARARPAAGDALRSPPWRPAPPAPWSRASTTSWSAGSPPGSARTPRPRRPARTSSA